MIVFDFSETNLKVRQPLVETAEVLVDDAAITRFRGIISRRPYGAL